MKCHAHRRSPRLPLASAAAALILLAAASGRPQQGGLASFLDRVEVRVVNVDVVVLDSFGNPMRGLASEDFEVFENGEPVEISNFAAYDVGIANWDWQTTGRETAETPAETDVSVLLPPPVSWVIFVDQTRLEPGPRNLVLRQVRDFLDRARKRDELVMIATWDGFRLRVVSEFLKDKRAIDSALTDLQREASPANFRRARTEQIERDVLNVGATTVTVGAGIEGPEIQSATGIVMAEALREEIALDAEQQARETQNAIEGFQDLLGLIDGIDGRVVMLFAGGGYDLDPGDALAELWSMRFRQTSTDTVTAGTGVRASKLAQAYLDTLQVLNSGRITVHTIFGGPVRGPDVSAASSSGSFEFGALTSAGGSVGAGSTLSGFAEETGGRSFNATSDLSDRLDLVRRDMSFYYSLGYHPDPASDRGLRKIEVRVRREGARVIHRAALAERTAEERAEAAAFAALIRPESQPTTAARIETQPPRDAPRGRGRVVPVRIALPVRELALLPDGAQHHAKLLFRFVLATPDGVYLSLEPRRFEFEIPNEELAKALGGAVSYEVELPLDPGQYRLGVSVQDELAGSYFTLVAPVEMRRGR